ncbi:MAG: ROK family transcriptional regulator [Aestuariivirgaceae bacterium]|nr:ROK family transcriptional regulator [Aestuariivirgaceae bacterium]
MLIHSPTATAQNRLKLMEALIGHGFMSRNEIGQKTGLSAATVSETVSALLGDGLIVVQKTNAPTRGRPAQRIGVQAAAGHVVGIKLSMHEATIALTNFAGQALGSRKIPHAHGARDAIQSALLIGDGVLALAGEAGLGAGDIAGIGVGLPGFVESEGGRCLWSPVFPDGADAFADWLFRVTGIAVQVDNDVNLVTLAERWFGAGRDVDHFMVITLEHGLGMGLFLNGELYAGPNGLAAEFGHVIVERDGVLCRCGRKGCLEAYVCDGALARQAAPILRCDVPQDGAGVNALMQEMTQRALQGDSALREIYAQAGTRLGRETGNIANILAPQRIIVTGEAMRAEDFLMRPFTDGFQESLLPMLRGQTELLWHKTSDEVWAKGAAARVLRARFAGTA